MYTQNQWSKDTKMFKKSMRLILLALVLVLTNSSAYAWNGTFSGNIDPPLAGIRVYCSGTGTTTTTNSSGAWSFTKTNIGVFESWTPGLATILGPIPEGYSFRPMGFWSGTLTNLNTSSTNNNSTYTQVAGVRLGEFSGGASGDSLRACFKSVFWFSGGPIGDSSSLS